MDKSKVPRFYGPPCIRWYMHLRVEWKMKQFEVFEERSLEPMTLDKESLPRADVIDDAACNRFLWVSHRVVNIDQRIPVLSPVHRFRVLCEHTEYTVSQN